MTALLPAVVTKHPELPVNFVYKGPTRSYLRCNTELQPPMSAAEQSDIQNLSCSRPVSGLTLPAVQHLLLCVHKC